MGSALFAPNDEVTSTQSTVHQCQFPLWAVKVSDFLQMRGPPESHNVLQEKGLLHQWYPGMFVVFISHQWLSAAHPDPQGQQVEVLRDALQGLVDGSLHVHEAIIVQLEETSLSASTRRHIAEGFIFFDYFAIPQITARSQNINDEERTKLAVRSIPAYVELSSIFIALVPELTHKDSDQLVYYTTWLSRGWCRAELWCRLLSNKADTSVIVVYSATEAEFMFPLDWQHNSIVEGSFTVEADRAEVVKLGDMAVESKIKHLQEHGPLSHYRFYTALRPKLLNQPRKGREVESFLRDFRFNSLPQAIQDCSGMNAVMCATLSGDTSMLRRLAESRASMNYSLQGMNDLGYYDTQTVLMAATKSRQESSMLALLIELHADVNASARTGLNALYMCRSPEHVKVLVDHRAEIKHVALSGAASLSDTETVQALLRCRCDPNQTEDNLLCPLQAIAIFSHGNSRAVDNAKLLLAHRADIDATMTLSGSLLQRCWKSRAKVAVFGFSNCNMMTRMAASMPGLTPLGFASFVGHKQLVQLYLDHGAHHGPNDRGDFPEDLARNNHHYHILSMLDLFTI